MDKETARDEIRRAWKQFGEPDRQKKGVVCPFCGNGSGKDGDGIREIPNSGGKLHCFRCDWSGDAVDLIQHASGCSYPEALNKGAAALGLSLDDTEPPRQPKPKPAEKPPADEEPLPDFTDEINRFHRVCDDPTAAAYLKSRGISADIADKYGIRYDPRRRAIIAPFHKNSGYAIRALDPDGFKGNGDGHKNTMFNARALGQSAPVFVTEGWADALSIIEAGGNALALNGTARTPLLDALQRMKKAGCSIPPIILALDDDSAGRGATARTAAELSKSGTFYITGNLYPEGAKDANEALQKDRTAFAAAVARDIGRAASHELDAEYAERMAEVRSVNAQRNSAHMDAFLTYLEKAATRDRISTGFPKLDDLLGGGLYPALFALGGSTGTGKTTLALQMADYIAAQGRPVLYVALEMSRFELIAKSISRITSDMSEGGSPGDGIAYRDILNGRQTPLVQKAAQQYSEAIAPHIVTLEGIGDMTATKIRRAAHIIQETDGTAPVIIVDYLQIMAPRDVRATDKQNIDHNVVELKRISRDLDTPVIAVSSLNREGQKQGMPGLYSFKESGAIEYTADVAMILHGVKGRDRGADVGLAICKNRRGPVPRTWQGFRFYEAVSALHAGGEINPKQLFTGNDVTEYTGKTPWSKEQSAAKRKSGRWDKWGEDKG